MSDSTLSRRASLFTEDRAEDPGKDEENQIMLKPTNNPFLKIQITYYQLNLFGSRRQILKPATPGVLRLLMKAFLGVACSSSKSNSVGVGGLGKEKGKSP